MAHERGTSPKKKSLNALPMPPNSGRGAGPWHEKAAAMYIGKVALTA